MTTAVTEPVVAARSFFVNCNVSGTIKIKPGMVVKVTSRPGVYGDSDTLRHTMRHGQ